MTRGLAAQGLIRDALASLCYKYPHDHRCWPGGAAFGFVANIAHNYNHTTTPIPTLLLAVLCVVCYVSLCGCVCSQALVIIHGGGYRVCM